MEKLKVVGVNDHILQLLNVEDNEIIDVMFEFYGVGFPKIGDKMLIHKRLLNKQSPLFVQPYAFELTDDKTAEFVSKEENRDYMLLHSNKNVYVLKRSYG